MTFDSSITALLRAGQEMSVQKALDEITQGNLRQYIPTLIAILETTEAPLIRNSIAIALRDLGTCEVLPILLSLAERFAIQNQAGTLVYAMQDCDCRSYVDRIAALTCSPSLEAREMALQILENMNGVLASNLKENALTRLAPFMTSETDAAIREYAESAFSCINSMHVD